MRIAIIHSFYSSTVSSGENAVVYQQLNSLRASGHTVLLLAKYTDFEKAKHLYRTRSAYRVITGHGANFKRELSDFGPDVLLIHNLFPNIANKWLREVNAKKILFLHNYRPWCSNGFMLRKGKSCKKCLRRPIWSVIYRCADQNLGRSVVQYLGRKYNSDLENQIHFGAQIVSVSSAAERNIPEIVEKLNIKVLMNFVEPVKILGRVKEEAPNDEILTFLWTGRISPEKGLRELLTIWPHEFQLHVFGDGPQAEVIKNEFGQITNIRFMGRVENTKILELIPRYCALIASSTWEEFAPMSLIESIANGVPVVVPKHFAIASLIEKFGAGLTFEVSNKASLLQALTRMHSVETRRELTENAKQLHADEFSFNAWEQTLMKLIKQ